MNTWDRFTCEMIQNRLDRNLCTLAEAKRFYPGIEGRTKKEWLRNLWKANREWTDSLSVPKLPS